MTLLNKLNQNEKNLISLISDEAKKQGIRAFVVGGVVRDLILNKEIKDIDFLIEGSAINFVKKAGFEIKSIHESFDTAKVLINNEEIDIASTRSENYPKSGCLPVVNKVGIKIEDDLKRRDFTINSIAIDIINNEIIDPFNGKDDIQNGVLKVLHNKSYIDDPTRILRGLDFKYRFNFDFSNEDKILIEKTLEDYDREGLSIDRIYLTLNKIFSFSYSNKILKEIIEKEIYKIWTNKVQIKIEEIEEIEKTIQLFEIEEKNKFYIMALEAFPYIKAPLKNDFEIYEFFKKFKSTQLAFYYFKTKDENSIKYLKIKDIKPLISGKTLIDNGFEQGEIIGQILNSILKEKILNPNNLKTVEDEINFALKMKP